MKKNNHITINIEDDNYNKLKVIADNERRTLTATAYLLLIDSIEQKTKELKEDVK